MDDPIIIALCIVFGIFLIAGGIFLFLFLKNKKGNTQYNEKIQNIILNLGGKDNIINVTVKMSRAEFILNNYELVNKEELKNLGIQGISKTSQKITLVIGNELAKDIENTFKKI